MMNTILKNVNIKSIIIIAVVSCISFGLGYYTVGKVNMANERPGTIKRIGTDVKILEDMDTTNNNEDDPLIHLKMLQEDVETFKALMEEVKNVLFVTDNA
tara:strand:+ start:2193 stop:2492 length:300 start_codon:yes stop_codon:yes gene_type:complete